MKIALFVVLLLFESIILFGQLEANEKLSIVENKPIILIGDTQRTGALEFWRDKNEGVAKKIFDQIASEEPECVFHLGDMVNNGSSKNAWNDFFYDAANVINKNIPVYPALGNHEYTGNNKKAIGNLLSRFSFLKNSTWYSKIIGNASFIILNSNFGELNSVENKNQLEWYKNELEILENDPTIDFVIVICHHPPYTNSKSVSDDLDVQREFLPLFQSSSKTKILFSGHCHSYEHFVEGGKHFIVSGGGGGPRQKLLISKDKTRHNDIYKSNELRNFHYIKISSVNKNILVEMIQLDSSMNEFNMGDSFKIFK